MSDEGFVRFGATVYSMRAESNSSQQHQTEWSARPLRPRAHRRPTASAFGWRRKRPVPTSRAHLVTVTRCQEQRHRALLIGISARQRIAVAVHRRASPPAVQPGHGAASPASRRRARKAARAVRRPSAHWYFRGGGSPSPSGGTAASWAHRADQRLGLHGWRLWWFLVLPTALCDAFRTLLDFLDLEGVTIPIDRDVLGAGCWYLHAMDCLFQELRRDLHGTDMSLGRADLFGDPNRSPCAVTLSSAAPCSAPPRRGAWCPVRTLTPSGENQPKHELSACLQPL
jgi:hypothetical protein